MQAGWAPPCAIGCSTTVAAQIAKRAPNAFEQKLVLRQQLMAVAMRPGQDELLAVTWPQFVRLKEAGLIVPGTSELYWVFDEILRLGVLGFLSQGQPLNIEIPDTNNPNHT